MAEEAVDVRQRIRLLLIALYGGDQFVGTISDTVALRQAGVSSNALVSLLVAMEEEFSFEWDDDVQPEALRSIESLADHVLAVRL